MFIRNSFVTYNLILEVGFELWLFATKKNCNCGILWKMSDSNRLVVMNKSETSDSVWFLY